MGGWSATNAVGWKPTSDQVEIGSNRLCPQVGDYLPVDVELFGGLKNNLPRRQTMILQNPITVDEFITRLGLRDEDIGLIVIDGAQKELDDLVPTTCRLCFFPPVSGGGNE